MNCNYHNAFINNTIEGYTFNNNNNNNTNECYLYGNNNTPANDSYFYGNNNSLFYNNTPFDPYYDNTDNYCPTSTHYSCNVFNNTQADSIISNNSTNSINNASRNNASSSNKGDTDVIEPEKYGLTEHELAYTELEELKRKIGELGYSGNEEKMFLQWRRVLKSRNYTKKCREKNKKEIRHLEKQKIELQTKANQLKREIELYKQQTI